MLPEEKMSNEYPLLAEPRTVRLKFCKTGSLQYISHLDLQRTFGRILSRADLPLWFTQGFNPHPKLVFAVPLAIGVESVCELAEIRIIRDMPCEEICRRMSRASVKELDFLNCYIPERKFSDIAYAGYVVRFDAAGAPKAAEIEKLLTTSPLIMTKHTKSGDKETDIVPMIKKIRITEDEKSMYMRLLLNASEGNTLSPELVVSAIKRELGFPGENSDYSVIREYFADGETKEFV